MDLEDLARSVRVTVNHQVSMRASEMRAYDIRYWANVVGDASHCNGKCVVNFIYMTFQNILVINNDVDIYEEIDIRTYVILFRRNKVTLVSFSFLFFFLPFFSLVRNY